MVEMTMEIPDALAARIEPIRSWVPTILGLSLDGFRTPATETVAEVIQFLSSNPSAGQVSEYHVSGRAQTRLRRLLTLNEAGLLGEAEQLEPDELQRIEHAIVMLKAQLATEERGEG